jgi:hypothetical protein
MHRAREREFVAGNRDRGRDFDDLLWR